MRWLTIDHGTVRIGLAVGDTDDAIASPLEAVPAEPRDAVFRRVSELAEQYDAVGVVVGWPLNMDDTEGPQGQLARRFAADLAVATGLDVRLWDERLSSMSADAKLAGHYTRKKRRARQDAVAAAAICQDFLAVGGADTAPRPRDVRPAT